MIDYLTAILTFVAIYAILAMGLNLQWGFAGLVNLGHVGFFAAGAYTGAILNKMGVPFPISLLAAVATAALFGAFVSLTSLRLREDFLAIVTLGFSEILRLFLLNESWLTGGANGITAIPRPLREMFADGHGYDKLYFLLLVAVLIILFLMLEGVRLSPFGRMLRAIREDELIASVAGKHVFRVKVETFTLGAALAGLAGVFYAHYLTFIAPDMFVPMVTINVWVAVIAGGSGNNKGAVLGALVLLGFLESTRFLKDFIPMFSDFRLAAVREMLVGFFLILLMIYRQEGILPEEKIIRERNPRAEPL
jgi:ABC-type branched-subunit amino acid transport system permease subunit